LSDPNEKRLWELERQMGLVEEEQEAISTLVIDFSKAMKKRSESHKTLAITVRDLTISFRNLFTGAGDK